MKKRILLEVVLLAGLLFACQPAGTPAIAEPTVVIRASPTSTPTTTPAPTSIPATSVPKPSKTPNAISLPPITGRTEAHPLALDENNTAVKMKRINALGTGTLQDIKFSPDGRYLAAATGRGVYLYDSKTFEETGFIDVNNLVSAVAVSPDGMSLAVAVEGKVSLWNVNSGQKMFDFDGNAVRIWGLAYGKGGYVAAVGSDCLGCGSPQEIMILWNAKTGQQIYSEHDIWYSTNGLAFTSDGERLAFGGKGGLTIIESATGKKIGTYQSGGRRVSEAIDAPFDFVFANDDKSLFVTSSQGETSQVLDTSTQQRRVFTLCQANLSRANDLGACASKDNVIFFDLANGGKISSVKVPEPLEMYSPSALSPDGSIFVYNTKETMLVIDSQTGLEIKKLFFSASDDIQVGIISLNGQKKYFAALQNQPGQIDLIDLETGVELQTLNLTRNVIQSFAFRPDYKIIAVVDGKKSLGLWTLQPLQQIYATILPEFVHGPITFSPDGSSLFLTSIPEDYVLEHVLSTGKTLNHGRNSFPYSYADPFVNNNYHFNKSGSLVMLHYSNHFPEIRDVKTDQGIIIPLEIISDVDFIESFAYSPDNKFLAFGNPGGISVWDVENLKLVSSLTGHESSGADGWMGKIRSLTFSPQSDLLVSVGWDETIRLWNIQTGQELRRLNVCCSATFTPDGRFLITAGDGVIRVWGIPNQP
jgi:WD40 repeat protein